MVAIGGDEDVLRLDVPVDQPTVVRRVERIADLVQDSDGASHGKLAARDQILEVRSADQPHREEEAALALTCLVHGDDMRMLECGLEQSLTPEALPKVGVLAQFGRDDLERHRPVEGELRRLVDGAHASLPDQRVDSVPLDNVPYLEHPACAYWIVVTGTVVVVGGGV